MTLMKVGLREVAHRYTHLIVDVWGVLTNGQDTFPEAVLAIRKAREAGLTVSLASNTSRIAGNLQRLLDGIGITDSAYDQVHTSGDITLAALRGQEYGPGCRYLHLGSRQNTEWIGTTGAIEVAELERADVLVATGTYDPEADRAQVDTLLSRAVERGLPLLCANPDRAVDLASGIHTGVGHLADRYEAAGGQAHRFGKPQRHIYDLCLGPGHPGGGSVLAIGDSFATDIQGAATMGFHSAFVAGTGIHRHELMAASPARVLTDLIARHGVAPTYVVDQLRW